MFEREAIHILKLLVWRPSRVRRHSNLLLEIEVFLEVQLTTLSPILCYKNDELGIL